MEIGATAVPGVAAPDASAGAWATARWPYRAATLAVLGAFNALTFNRYFPLSEGWWETYGYLYNEGLRPYRDFDLAFTPLFTVINAGLLRLLGDSFFALRLLGVGVFLLAVFVLQLLVEQFASAKTAAVAVLVATFFVILEPQFIAKDYHLYQLLFVALALLLHVRLAREERLGAGVLLGGTVLLGVVAALVFLLKQNVGGLLGVAIAASLPLVERERPFARVAAFCVGVALALAATLPVVSLSEWRQLLLANDAKGSLGTVLGRVWQLDLNRAPLVLAAKMAVAYGAARWALAPPSRWRGVWSDSFEALRRRRRARGAVMLGVVVLVAASGHWVRRTAMPWVLPLTLTLLLVALFRVARGALERRRAADPALAAIVLPMLALAYANTTTAAFDFNGMHVPIALAIGWALGAVEAWAPVRYWLVGALALLVVVPEIFAAKLRVPYGWWGHKQAPVSQAVHEPDYPQLRGMRVSAAYRDTLNAVKRDVERYSQTRSDAFFFNLPVLYWLHGKLPPFRTVVHWFDVVSSSQMDADLRAMQQAPPRIIVAMEPLPAAYAASRDLKNTSHLPQEDFRDLMDAWVAAGKYRLVRSIALPHGTLEGCDVTQEVVVQNASSVGEPLEAVLARGGREAAAVNVKRGERYSTVPPREGVLEAGEIVTLQGEYEHVRMLSEMLGVARGVPRDWHAVLVYVRADAAAAGP